MIVDVHTRIWDSTEALGRGAELLRRRRGEPWQWPDASPAAHNAAMTPVQTCIVHGYESQHLGASIPVEKVAEYIRHHESCLGFAGIDPTIGKPVRRLENALDMGMVGVTLSPSAQGFHPTDSRAMDLYEACEARGLPIFFDSSQMLTREAMLEFGQPYLLDEAARTFPDLKMVISGMGYPWIEQGLAMIGKHPGVFADLADIILHPWRVYNAMLLAHQHGVTGQVLFGSNFPFCTPERAIVAIYSANTFAQGTHLPTVPREQLRSVVERDALACLGLPRPGAAGGNRHADETAERTGEAVEDEAPHDADATSGPVAGATGRKVGGGLNDDAVGGENSGDDAVKGDGAGSESGPTGARQAGSAVDASAAETDSGSASGSSKNASEPRDDPSMKDAHGDDHRAQPKASPAMAGRQ